MGDQVLEKLGIAGVRVEGDTPTSQPPAAASSVPNKPQKSPKAAKPSSLAVPPPTFNLPPVVKVETLGAGSRIPSQAERDAFRAQKAQVAEAVEAYGREIVAPMCDVVQEMADFDQLPEDEQEAFSERRKVLDGWLQIQFAHPAEYRMCAVRAYVDARIKTIPAPVRRGDLETAIARAVKAVFLVPEEKGVYVLYGTHYNLGKEYRGDKASEEVVQNLIGQIKVAADRTRNRWLGERVEVEQKLNEVLDGNSPITFDEFDAGVEGSLTLPDGFLSLEVPDKKDGERYFAGGYVIVRVEEAKIRPVHGTGHLARTMSEVADAGTFVWAPQLRSGRIEINPNVSEEGARQIRKLHRVFHRALLHGRDLRGRAAVQQAKKEQEAARLTRKGEFGNQLRAEREALQAKQTVTSQEFFLEEKPGKTYVRYGKKGPFVQRLRDGKERNWWGVQFLVERDQEGKVKAAEYPERLKELLSGKPETATLPGKNFENLGWPLGSLLRMAKSWVQYLASNAAAKTTAVASNGSSDVELDDESGAEIEEVTTEVPAAE